MAKEKEEEKKVKLPTAKKRDLQGKRRNLQNNAYRSSVSTAIRSFEQMVSQGDFPAAKEKLKKVFSLVDKGVKTNRFKLNTASRMKARLTKRAVKA